MDRNYKIADMKQKEFDYFKQVEEQIKMELGKDIILIAWEKNMES